MDVAIPAELEPFVRSVISSGTYDDAEQVVGEALRLLEKREQLRREVQAGVEQLNRGEYAEYDEHSFGQFLEDVRTEQRRRFTERNDAP